jgi:hypothetical protein
MKRLTICIILLALLTIVVVYAENICETCIIEDPSSCPLECTPPAENGVTCTENWSCNDWSSCEAGKQTRTCTDLNNCGTMVNKPAEEQSCEVLIEENITIPEEITSDVTPEETTPEVNETEYISTEEGLIEENITEPIIQEGLTEEITEPVKEKKRNLSWIIISILILGVVAASIIFYKTRSKPKIEKAEIFYSPEQMEKLENYIRNNLQKGYSAEQIKYALVDDGWNEKVVDEIIKRFS